MNTNSKQRKVNFFAFHLNLQVCDELDPSLAIIKEYTDRKFKNRISLSNSLSHSHEY